MVALEHALRHLEGAPWDPGIETRLCTDSQSALKALEKGPSGQSDRLGDDIWAALARLTQDGRHITLQNVPAHVNLQGNELADRAAKEASNLPQQGVEVNLTTAAACLRRATIQQWNHSVEGRRHAIVTGPGGVRRSDLVGLTRTEAVSMARLRTGHTRAIRAYRHRIGQEPDDACPDCDTGEAEDLQHLFQCPAKMPHLMAAFGRPRLPVEDALSDTDTAVDYLRRLGRLGC
jgi:hypothetical protein